MKRLLFWILLVTSAISVYAQKESSNFSGRTYLVASFGASTPLGNDNYGGKDKAQIAGDAMYGYNFGKGYWSTGLYVGVDNACRKYQLLDETYQKQKNRTYTYGIFGMYRFLPEKPVTPFVHLAVGVGIHDIEGDVVYPISEKATPVVIPRIGVEIVNSLRLNLYTQISRKGYNTAGVSVSFVLDPKSIF
jgi:hypothetical protein